MKRYITIFVLTFVFWTLVININVEAAGGYCVINGQTVYHSIFCSETWGQNIENMKWYKTQKEVEQKGYSPCECCSETVFDYEEDRSTRWYSKDAKIQNALEMERFMGVVDTVKTMDDETENKYQEGYEAGREEAISESQLSIDELKKELEEEKGKTPWIKIVITAFASFFAGCYYKKQK